MKTATVEAMVWVLVYGGLLLLVVSLFASRHDAALGGWLRLGGAAMVGLGLVLIVVRSRMRR